jgi:prepilin-type N-terminal cleavage/methylation domain-containing protein
MQIRDSEVCVAYIHRRLWLRILAKRIQKFDRSGFSLVELLVVIAIVGVLSALLLPAIQMARESARRATCSNNLKQVGLAALLHCEAFGHFPTGGWGGSWTGDPNRGFGPAQPGGWVFAILDFVEQGSVRTLGTAASNDAEKQLAAGEAASVVLPMLYCPSRRAARLYPMPWPYPSVNATLPPTIARSDYAMNAGDAGVNSLGMLGTAGPNSIAAAATTYPWPASNLCTGVTYFRSKITPKQVLDGMSTTYLIGEKYVIIRDYHDGQSVGDRGFALIGFSPDTVRMTLPQKSPARDAAGDDFTLFGSAHPTACGFVFCDGSVRIIAYDVDPEVHRSHGNRRDQ